MMKLSLVCLFSLLAIATASYELKFTPNGLEYVSPNIRVTTDGVYAKIQLADDLQTFVESVSYRNEFALGTEREATLLRCSFFTKKAIEDAILTLTEEIKGPGLADLVVVTPNYIHVKENKTEVEFVLYTDGLAYLSTSPRAAVVLSPNSFKVTQIHGRAMAMDVGPVKDSVKRLSDALAAEAKYWIELLKDKIVN